MAERGVGKQRKIMQNRTMVTRSNKPREPAPPRTPPSEPDFSMDPLPVPEAVESDSDTAWGLWQDTVQAHNAGTAAPKPPSEFDDTVPAPLFENPPSTPKR
jgi:hypothetical protein